MAVADNSVLRVAGYEENLQVGPQGSGSVCYLPAVETTRQTDVGDQQIDTEIGPQNPKPAWTVGRLKHAIASVPEHIDHQRSKRLLVVDDENRLAVPALGGGVILRGVCRVHLADEPGKIQAHGGALPISE